MKSAKALIFGLVGAIIYRWRGHASKYKKYLPRPLPQIVFSLPYAYVAFLSGGWFLSILCFILTLLATLTGHGNGHDLGQAERGEEDETMEFIVKWLHGKIPEYWYDVLLMSVLGVLITLSCGLITGSVWIALSGALRGMGYMIGHYTYNNAKRVSKRNSSGQNYSGVKWLPRHLDGGTEIGEFLTGLFLWSSLCLLVSF